MNIKDFKFIKVVRELKDKNGRIFGVFDGEKYCISLEHWKKNKKYYSQWKLHVREGYEQEGKSRNIGTVNVTDEPINVEKRSRSKHLKETILSQYPITEEEMDIFLAEVVDMANRLGNKLFPKDLPKKEKDDVPEINGFQDYDESIKVEANAIFNEDPLKYFMEILEKVHYGDNENKEILLLVLFTKHVLNGKPVHVLIVGTTESGKTSLANKTAKITPKRFLIETNTMSGKAAFYHQDAFRDDHNHLIINDFLDSPEAIATLKAMTDTEIKTVKHMTVSDDKKPVTLEIKGKNTVIVTAAKQLIDREMNRRLLHLNPEESEEHEDETKGFIIENEAGISKEHRKEFELAEAIYDKIIEKEYEVYIPWILALDRKPFSKTDIKHFTNLIKARTLIYQAQRVEIIDGVLLASLEDFQEVARLWNHISKMQATYLPAKAFEILKIIPSWNEEKHENEGHYGLKIKEIAQELSVSRETIQRYLWGHEEQRGLIDLGFVHPVKNGESLTSTWILYLKDDNILQEDDEALQLAHLQMFKGFITPEEKQKVVITLCTLYQRKGYLKGKNLKELSEIICNHFRCDFDDDHSIIELSEYIKNNFIDPDEK